MGREEREREKEYRLRWESIGEQWWFASPIDYAAANGLYDLVLELLHLDPNLLIKLTSLRRIRRLESVWDDDVDAVWSVGPSPTAVNRARVARRLLESAGHAPLVRAGYGGWLLYTAAAAGDFHFAAELLRRDPLLAYGEGEYGLTDLLYAAARGRSLEVFRAVVGAALAPSTAGDELRWEVVNRAAHAAARGGNVDALQQVFEEFGDSGGDVLKFKDDQGCCLLHSAAGRGQVEVVKYLIERFGHIAHCTDNHGNTAVHVAAHRGFLSVVEVLLRSNPTLATTKNDYGDTFLHMAVAGFRAPGFRRLDKLLELVRALILGDFVDIGSVVNVRNSDGRTALHAAVADNADVGLVELLMSSPGINLNIRDFDGMTPLDLLKRRPRSASSEILIKQLISAGGISNCRDRQTRKALVSQLKSHGFGSSTSPGTSFRIPDGEIFLFTGIDTSASEPRNVSTERFSTFSGNLGLHNHNINSQKKKKKSISMDLSAAKRLNLLLKWPKKKDTKKDFDDSDSDSNSNRDTLFGRTSHVSLRQKYSKAAYISSPSTAKMRFAVGLTHGVIKTPPPLPLADSPARNNEILGSSATSSPEKTCGPRNGLESSSLDRKSMMNEYFSFGAKKHVHSYTNYTSSSLVV